MNFATKTMGAALIVAGIGIAMCRPSTAQEKPASTQRIKLIEAGWERPDSADLLKHLKEIEKTPYDGIVVMLKGKDDDGKTVVMQSTFTDRPWKRQWFAQNIKELQAAKSPQLTDNFVRIGTNPGNVDWFDDAGWKNIVDHWRIIAWVAKQGGLKGILFDPEPYAKPHFQLNYAAQPQHNKHSFAEYQAKARQRGREVMNAVKSEYPEMTIFSFFMNSVNARSAAQADPQRALETAGYNLYPAFINGWLDAAPPTLRFVDGCESAYHYDGEMDYLRAANNMRRTVLSLVAPENRDKYRMQVQAGFAFYLDAYTNPSTSRYYKGPLNGSRTARLKANLDYAARISDGYIWTWGEKYRWFPTNTSRVNPQYWEEVLPGVTDALRATADPQYWIEQEKRKFAALEKTGTLVNLVSNGSFDNTDLAGRTADHTTPQLDWKNSTNINDWSTWQKAVKDTPPGHFQRDTGIDHTGKTGSAAARISGMTVSGTLIQSIDVKPGERYAVRAWQRFAQANGKGNITVRWQDANRNWQAEQQDVPIQPPHNTKAGAWHQLTGFVTVPDGVARLVLLLGARNQTSADDVVWYDDVQVYKLP